MPDQHPRPWRAGTCEDRSCWHGVDANGQLVFSSCSEEVAKLIVQVMNADEIQRRRGWNAVQHGKKWAIWENGLALYAVENPGKAQRFFYPPLGDTPAATLIAAEEWMRQRESEGR